VLFYAFLVSFEYCGEIVKYISCGRRRDEKTVGKSWLRIV